MKISVIVPIYGVERYIERCARSILEQSYADKEIIFVDDASLDLSMPILETILPNYPQQQVVILHHDRNRGLAAARLTGIQAATGEYIVSVDSDDYLEPDALIQLADKAEQTNADIIGMDCYFDWGTQRKIYRGEFSSNPEEYSKILLSGAALPNVWRHMIRKSLYEKTGFYPVPGTDNGEDYMILPRICWYARGIAKVHKPLYHYSQTNTGSITRNVSEPHILQLIQVVRTLTDFFADKPECAAALRAGQWLKKTDLMMCVQKSNYALVDTMPAFSPAVYTTMTLPQRIAARMIVGKQWKLLNVYCRIYRRMMETLQQIKGRRKKC